jgi:DNA helicase-2/ATP-dependent DNA helicase PcrA
MYDDMVNRHVDTANLTVSDLGLFSNPNHNVKLITIHQAKGREFDAVAIIDLHDRQLPNWRATQPGAPPEALEESKRLFYVAITRTRRLLMYVTDTSNARNTPSRFLRTVVG